MMEETLIQRLKPWISVFSAEMAKNKNGDNVKVGGKIKSIVDFSSMDLDIGQDGVETYVTIDDSIGTTDLLFIKNTFKTFNDTYAFKPDMVILAEGKVLKEKRHPEDKDTNSIICWSIEPLDKVEGKK